MLHGASVTSSCSSVLRISHCSLAPANRRSPPHGPGALRLPRSIDAHRYVVQLLVALGRPGETVEPLRSLIAQTPAPDRPALISALPRFFAIAGDKKPVPGILEQVLEEPLRQPATRIASLQALAGGSMLAQEFDRAFGYAQRPAVDPRAEAPVLIALRAAAQAAGSRGVDHGLPCRAAETRAACGSCMRVC